MARLRKKGNLAGLADAASYQEVQEYLDGETRNPGVTVRVEALRALFGEDGPEVERAVAAALADRAPTVRSTAVELVRESAVRSASEALVRGLAVWPDPPFGEARRQAEQTLAAWRTRGTAQQLALALVEHGEGDLVRDRDEALIVALLPSDAAERDHELGEIAEVLVARLADEDLPPVVRGRAEEVAGWIGTPSRESLRRGLRGAEPELAVIKLAGRLGDQQLLDDLIPLCGHRDPSRRATAALAIGEVSDTRGVAALLRLTQDEAHGVRQAAISALDRFGVAGAVFGLAAAAAQPELSGAAEARAEIVAPRADEPGIVN